MSRKHQGEEARLRTDAGASDEDSVDRSHGRQHLSGDEQEMRGTRSATEDHERHQENGTAFTNDELEQMIRNEFQAEALPTVPKLAGWHLCWLSQTNTHDPIARRMRLGYVPVRLDEIGESYSNLKMKSGEFEGCVSCNEMLLFKLPMDRYQAIMHTFHHKMPLEEEEALREQLRQGDHTQDSAGNELIHEEEGFKGLAQRRRASVFE